MTVQSIAEVERICYQNELDRAEARMSAQDEEPSARECFENCVHGEACRRIYGLYADSPDTEELVDLMVVEIGCAECQEYEAR